MSENKDVKIKNVLLIAIICVVVLIVGAVIYIVSQSDIQKNDVSISENVSDKENQEIEEINIKEDQSKEYIYQKESYNVAEGIDIKIPYININTKEVKDINEELLKLYNQAVASVDVDEQGNGSYTDVRYEYNIVEDKILSVKVESSDCVIPGGGFQVNRKVYNIDLEDGSVLTTELALNKLGLTVESFKEKINNQLRENYQNNTGLIKETYQTAEEYIKVSIYDISNVYFESSKNASIMIDASELYGGQEELKIDINK